MKSLAMTLGVVSSVAAFSASQQPILSAMDDVEIMKSEEEGGGFTMRLHP